MLKFQGCSIWWLHLRVPSLQLTYIDPIKLPSEKKRLHSDFEQAIFNEDAGFREATVPPCLKKTIVIQNHQDSNRQAFHVCLSDKGRGFARNPSSRRDTSFELERFHHLQGTYCFYGTGSGCKKKHTYISTFPWPKNIEFTKIFSIFLVTVSLDSWDKCTWVYTYVYINIYIYIYLYTYIICNV